MARPSKSMIFKALLGMGNKLRTNTDHFATSRGRVGARGAVCEHAGRAGDKCGGQAGAGAKWSEGRQAAKEGAGAGGKKAGKKQGGERGTKGAHARLPPPRPAPADAEAECRRSGTKPLPQPARRAPPPAATKGSAHAAAAVWRKNQRMDFQNGPSLACRKTAVRAENQT